jgi:peptidoglycan/xylan/chitin deacetylase (PgdA/CDA1 family)
MKRIALGLVGCAALAVAGVGCKQRSYNTVKDAGPGIPENGSEMFQRNNLVGSSFGLSKNDVALTFDDGPSNLSLPLAEFLAKKGVKATWFVNYKNATNLDNGGAQEIIRKICALGHHVGNHNFGHTYDTNYWDKLTDVHDKMVSLCPQAGVRYYRAPGGTWSPSDAAGLNAAVDSRGKNVGKQYIGPVFWDVACDTESDCASTNAQTLANRYYNRIISANSGRTGVIVLGHDVPWQAATVDAFMDTDLIDRLKAAGLRFVLLDKNQQVTTQLLGTEYHGGGSGSGGIDMDVVAKAKAKNDTMLKKAMVDSSTLPDAQKCSLKAGFTIGFKHVKDAGNKHFKIDVDARSSGCAAEFWDVPNKDVYIYAPHFTFLPRRCNQFGEGDSNVRSSPTTATSDNIVGKISGGVEVIPEGVDGDFFMFKYNGSNAYIHKSQLNDACADFPL